MSCCVVLPTNAERARSPVECHRLGTARHRDCDVADSGEALCGPLSGEDQPADECADGECVDHEPGSHLPALLFPIGRVGAMPLQNGSEIRSVELEQLTAQGISLIERRNAFEALRDIAADLYASHIGSSWRPATGSKVNRSTLTASMLDARDFMNARQRADIQTLAPKGPIIAFASATDYNDTDKIWQVLDKAFAKHPDMVLAHTGEKTGGPKIASCWATSRKVPQIAFTPDFSRHQKAAPFKRNDKILEAMPIGIIAGPGEGGVHQNLLDKARRQGVSIVELR